MDNVLKFYIYLYFLETNLLNYLILRSVETDLSKPENSVIVDYHNIATIHVAIPIHACCTQMHHVLQVPAVTSRLANLKQLEACVVKQTENVICLSFVLESQSFVQMTYSNGIQKVVTEARPSAILDSVDHKMTSVRYFGVHLETLQNSATIKILMELDMETVAMTYLKKSILLATSQMLGSVISLYLVLKKFIRFVTYYTFKMWYVTLSTFKRTT